MESFKEYSKKVSALSIRERVLICAVGVVLFASPAYFLFYDKNNIEIKKINSSISSMKEDLSAKQDELVAWQSRVTQNPNDVMRNEISSLERDIATLDAILTDETANLIDASEMSVVLSKLLSVNKDLSIISVESIKPIVIIKREDAQLYQHGIQITLKGKYLDILNHFKQLEGISRNFYWKTMDYKVVDYPFAEVTIELYTLSINKDFIRG